jgi:hypothetical protein
MALIRCLISVIVAVISEEVELCKDQEAAIAGSRCNDWHEVMEGLEAVLTGRDDYREARKRALKKYNAFVDAGSCHRVAALGISLVKARAREPAWQIVPGPGAF